MDSRKFTNPIDDTDPVERERIRAESARALGAVNSIRYNALRMYNYRTWPESGELRDELDRIDKLPLFELDEHLVAAGFQKST